MTELLLAAAFAVSTVLGLTAEAFEPHLGIPVAAFVGVGAGFCIGVKWS